MNTTRRSNKLLALTAASALVFAACGSDDADTSSGEASTETNAPAEDDAPAEDAPVETDAPAGDDAPAATDAPADGGGNTLVWAHEQEPPDLHLDDPENNLSITSWIRSAMIEGLYGISGSTEYYPELLDGEATLTTNDDGTVTGSYVLRDGLV